MGGKIFKHFTVVLGRIGKTLLEVAAYSMVLTFGKIGNLHLNTNKILESPAIQQRDK